MVKRMVVLKWMTLRRKPRCPVDKTTWFVLHVITAWRMDDPERNETVLSRRTTYHIRPPSSTDISRRKGGKSTQKRLIEFEKIKR